MNTKNDWTVKCSYSPDDIKKPLQEQWIFFTKVYPPAPLVKTDPEHQQESISDEGEEKERL